MIPCEVCGRRGAHVSVVACHEVFRCGECDSRAVVPWDVLVGTMIVSGASLDLEEVIRGSCNYYGRLEEELQAEVEFAREAIQRNQEELCDD